MIYRMTHFYKKKKKKTVTNVVHCVFAAQRTRSGGINVEKLKIRITCIPR